MDKSFLKGKRIAITAIDLQQKEHRGIASVTKSLIKLLRKYGADIFLITSIESEKIANNKRVNNQLFNKLYITNLIASLQTGFSYRDKFNENKVYAFILILKLIKNILLLYINKFNLKYKIFYFDDNLKKNKKFDKRLDYLIDIKGFIFVKHIFNLSRLRSMRFLNNDPRLNINKKEIDLIITSSPLSLRNKSTRYTKIVQLIHDAIPIQISSHPENPSTFFNKLYDAHKKCECIYVSKESKKVVREILNIPISQDEKDIIYPLPSINLEILKEAIKINSIKSINCPFILFNSSIEERKRVENAINYFKTSNLAERGFMLCIAGKMHKTKYCGYIRELCSNNRNILILDYVNELEKVWLFLNASLLISTSIKEGFGIPVLDAASIDLPVLGTKLPPYKEIKALIKNNRISLLRDNSNKPWEDYLNNLKPFINKNYNNKLNRLNYFEEFIDNYEKKIIFKIKKYIT